MDSLTSGTQIAVKYDTVDDGGGGVSKSLLKIRKNLKGLKSPKGY